MTLRSSWLLKVLRLWSCLDVVASPDAVQLARVAVVAGPVAARVPEMVHHGVTDRSGGPTMLVVTVTVVVHAVVAVTEGSVAVTVSKVAVTVSSNKVTVSEMPSVAELLHLRSWRQLLKVLCHDGV